MGASILKPASQGPQAHILAFKTLAQIAVCQRNGINMLDISINFLRQRSTQTLFDICTQRAGIKIFTRIFPNIIRQTHG